MTDVPRVLAFGGGVNTVAELLLEIDEDRTPDLVIFADTMEEHDYTYDYLFERIVPLCWDNGIPFVQVYSGLGRLVDYYTTVRAVPSLMRRDCTDKFKIDPIRRHLRRLGWKKVHLILGIAYDEIQRVKDSDVKWIENEYPLIDRKMTRADCEAVIAAHGWPSPKKSGCQGCPFSGKRGLAALLARDPVEFARWRAMETNGSRYPEITLVPKIRLEWMEQATKEQRNLLDFPDDGEEPCSGNCMV